MPRDRENAFEVPETLTGHALRNVCFQIPDVEEYRRAFWGHIYELTWPTKWHRENFNDDTPQIVAEYWEQILTPIATRFYDEIGCDDPEDCKAYSPGAPFVQWFPNDPYNTPALVPDGYNNPPWYLATTASNLALGSSTGDVITSIDRFPPGSLPSIIPASGLPRFRINVSGIGRITIHLVNLFAGSLIQLTKDDDPFTSKWIDVSRDTISIPPETLDAFQVEVEFDTPGLHWVDCIVVSWVNASIPFLHHGGGLRMVELCGFADMPLVPPTMIRSDPSGCGNLEKSTDGGETWTDINNTDYFRRDGVCDVVGQVRVKPPAAATVPLRLYAAPASSEALALWEGYNPAGQKVISFSGTNQATQYYGPDPTRLLQYFQTSGNSIIQNSGSNNALLISATGIVAANYNTQNGLSVGTAGVLENALLSLAANSATKRGIEIRNRDDSSDAFKLVNDSILMRMRITNEGAAELYESMKLRLLTSTVRENVMSVVAAWDDSTNATRKGRFSLNAEAYNGSREIMRGRNDAAQAMVGFLGATPQPRLALSGDCLGNAVVKSIAELLALFGLATDDTTLGTDPYEALDVTGDKFGNEALSSVITALDTLGIVNDLTSDTGAYIYTPPDPIEVTGSWQGIEAGKILSLALDANSVIIDSTELVSAADLVSNDRCAATSVIRWIIETIYRRAGEHLTYLDLVYATQDRWYNCLDEFYLTGLDDQDAAFLAWGEPLADIYGENGSPAIPFSDHYDEMVAYIPAVEEMFFCSLTSQGKLTEAGYVAFLDLVFDNDYSGANSTPGNITTWFYDFIRHFSSTDFGLMIAAAVHSDYPSFVDCSAYECLSGGASWCKQYNFTLGTYTPPFDLVSGEHVFGATFNPGWKSDETGIVKLEFPFPTIELTITYNITAPTDASSIIVGSIDLGYEDTLPVSSGLHEEIVTIPEANRADGWFIRGSCDPEECVITIKRVDNMSGTGLEPTDLNDC